MSRLARLLKVLNGYWRYPVKIRIVSVERVIARIGAEQDCKAVPSLIMHLYSDSEITSTAAAEAIQRIVDGSTPTDLARLDPVVRQASEWREPNLLARRIQAISHGMVGPLGIMSFHRSGFIREPAVQSLASFADGSELGFLLIRLNDWVPAVRSAAQTAVRNRIRTDYVAHFVHNLALVFRLREQGRGDHVQMFDEICALLLRTESRPALEAGLVAPDRLTRRLALKLVTELAPDAQLSILLRSLSSKDEIIRLTAAQHVHTVVSGEALDAILNQLLADRFMPVRREGVNALAAHPSPATSDRLLGALLDPHVSIREIARFHLRRAGQTDFAAFYRAQLNAGDERQLATALSGLGECGDRADIATVRPFLQHTAPRIRKAATQAVSRLDPDHFDEYVLSMLPDPSPSVSKCARNIAGSRAGALPPSRLWNIFESSEHAHVKNNALTLIGQLPWWDSAALLVKAVGSGDRRIQSTATSLLLQSQHPGRLTVRPSREQLNGLLEAYSAHSELLDARVREDLQTYLNLAIRG
jgi:hypothetical protein